MKLVKVSSLCQWVNLGVRILSSHWPHGVRHSASVLGVSEREVYKTGYLNSRSSDSRERCIVITQLKIIS